MKIILAALAIAAACTAAQAQTPGVTYFGNAFDVTKLTDCSEPKNTRYDAQVFVGVDSAGNATLLLTEPNAIPRGTYGMTAAASGVYGYLIEPTSKAGIYNVFDYTFNNTLATTPDEPAELVGKLSFAGSGTDGATGLPYVVVTLAIPAPEGAACQEQIQGIAVGFPGVFGNGNLLSGGSAAR